MDVCTCFLLKMKKWFCFVLFVYALFVHFEENNLAVAANANATVFNEFLLSTNNFSFRLYKILSENNGKTSILVSPITLQLVLALLYTGAQGETAKQLSQVLSLNTDRGKDMHLTDYNNLINTLKEPELDIVTKMFVENRFDIKEDFQTKAARYFESAVERVNFATDKDVINVINEWVESKTNGKIKELITADVINSNTVMVLVSVVHFKADWYTSFPESERFEGDFHATDDTVHKIDMMSIYDEKFKYLDHPELKATILEVPYKDNRFRMHILLPYSINGLPALEEALSQVNLFDVLKMLRLRYVDITLPKFKLMQTFDYKNVLDKLGKSKIFLEREADLSAISDGPLVVSNIVQNAFIEVNENGTEAAAGTGTGISLRSFQIKTHFRANHPFMFIISKSTDKKHGSPLLLFIGKFTSI